MLLHHEITIDLINPGPVPRVHVKQGDAMSRNIRITLLADGQPWPIPYGATAVVRYHAHDPNTMTDTWGTFDKLEDGETAYVYAHNLFEIMPTAALMANPGLVTMDVVLFHKDYSLATFDFEIYVNPAPAKYQGGNAEV